MAERNSKLQQVGEHCEQRMLSASLNLNRTDDLDRPVYGLLGIPIDVYPLAQVLTIIDNAADLGVPFLMSTPNVNFLTNSLQDTRLRESLIHSDLCLPDGMPIVWLSRLLRIPLGERVAGSDLFEGLRRRRSSRAPVDVFLFGGGEGVAEKLSRALNESLSGLHCAGWLSPGFGTVDELSTDDIIDTINESGAQLLAVFLSARKAQEWLLRNHHRLRIPIRAQFGATINYQAGTVRRAPPLLQKAGLEWLWRIKEEPYLWRRYARDGVALLNLTLLNALPLAAYLWGARSQKDDLLITVRSDERLITIELAGAANQNRVERAIESFRMALRDDREVLLDLSQTTSVDARFFGLLLMFKKNLHRSGRNLKLRCTRLTLSKLFSLNRFEYLISD